MTDKIVNAPAGLRGAYRSTVKANKLLTAENWALRRALLKMVLQDGDFNAVEGIQVMDGFRPQSDSVDDLVDAYTVMGASIWLEKEAS